MSEIDPQPADDYSEALLQSTVERLRTRADVRRFSCMTLPAPIFHDLCRRLLDRRFSVNSTAEWIQGQTSEAPTRSSVERFASALFDEFRLVELDFQMREAERFSAAATAGDSQSMQSALNHRLTQLLAGELLRAKNGESIDTKRLGVLMFGARTVTKNLQDKRTTDARVEAIAAQIRQRDTQIEFLRQKLNRVPEKLAEIIKKVDAIERQRSQGKQISPAIYEEIRRQLCGLAEEASTPALPAPSEPNATPAEAPTSGPDRVVTEVRKIMGIPTDPLLRVVPPPPWCGKRLDSSSEGSQVGQ